MFDPFAPRRIFSFLAVLSTSLIAHAGDEGGRFGSGTGIIVPTAQADLSFETEGVLASVSVEVGSSVKAGTELARIARPVLTQNLVALKAELLLTQTELKRATALLTLAEARLARERKIAHLESAELVEQAASQESVARLDVAMASARVEQTQARVRAMEAQVDQNVLRAPFDGVVTELPRSPGAWVGPQTPVARLISNSRKLRAALSVTQLPQLQVGSVLSLQLPEFKRALTARVTAIVPEIDAASRLVRLEATLLSPPDEVSRLPAGTMANVTFKTP